MEFKIKEKSILARICRFFMKSKSIAMVFGSTIHLSGVDRATFMANKKWFKHELEHIRQYKKYGIFIFLVLYTIESIRHGYYKNKFEIEATAAENK